ncbi:MAG: protease pro-enzyme activation domain-containing protein, partial [Myxococcota bacterium]
MFARIRLPALALVAAAAAAALPAWAGPQWTGTETRAHPVGKAIFRRYLADDEALDITVVLRLRNREALTRLATALTTPGSPAFRRWLDRGRVLSDYAPTEAQAQAVADYLSRSGFSDVRIEPGRMLVSASGTGRVIRKAFDTELAHFSRDGREGVANTRDARVPAALGDSVLAVLGLQTLGRMQRLNRRADSLAPLAGGSVHGLDAVLFPVAYDATGLPAASATAVGILTDGNMAQTVADLHTFESQHGLPTIDPVIVTVGRPGHDTSGTAEFDIDSQTIQAMAGGQVAQMVFYTAHSLLNPDFTQALNRAVTDNSVAVVNVSLGECESDAHSDGTMAALDQVFQTAIAQGQTISVSSGDFGAPECGSPQGSAVGASYPASSPYVIAVGGTTLSSDSGGNYAGEVAWSGSGGSPSLYEAKPAFQNGVVAGSFRGVPDVAFAGDPSSGVIVIVNGSPAQYGGTSLSSPLFVGAWARIQTANGARLGFPAAWIYSRGAQATPAFHDVLSGANNGFSAAAGWDYVTGFGSFDVAATALLTQSSVVVSVSPDSIAPGQSVTLTATVTGNSPAGTVQFVVNGSNLGLPVPLVNGVATLSTTSLTTVGTLSITAVYSGDANDAGSTTASPFIETVAVPPPVPALP